MKKMVCEVCGASSMKKVNGVFVCQECGTEYSLEEARKLLKEEPLAADYVGEVPVVPSDDNVSSETNEQTKLKLKYDLLCWHNFFQKCHELEKSLYIPDNLSQSGIDVASRKVEFDIDRYYSDVVIPKFDELYIKKNDYVERTFEAENQKIKQYNKNLANSRIEAVQSHKKKKAFCLVAGISCAVLGLIFFFIGISSSNVGSIIGFSVAWGILTLMGVPLIIIGGLLAQHGPKPITAKEKEPLVFTQFFQSEIKTTPKYLDKEKEWHKKFSAQVKTDIDGFISQIPQLKQIKEKLELEIPLPQKYTKEEHVDSLLSLVLDGRVDTLKEAPDL